MEKQDFADLHARPLPVNLIRNDLIKDGYKMSYTIECKNCEDKTVGICYKKYKSENQKTTKTKYELSENCYFERGSKDYFCGECFDKMYKENEINGIKIDIQNAYKAIESVLNKIKTIKNQTFEYKSIEIRNVIAVLLSGDIICIIELTESNSRKRHILNRADDMHFSTSAPMQELRYERYSEDGLLYQEDKFASFDFDEKSCYGTDKLTNMKIEDFFVFEKHYNKFSEFFDKKILKERLYYDHYMIKEK